MLRLMGRLAEDQAGVTMIEYALIAALVSVVAVGLLSVMRSKVKNLFTTVNSALATGLTTFAGLCTVSPGVPPKAAGGGH